MIPTSNRPSAPSGPTIQFALRFFTRRVWSLAPSMSPVSGAVECLQLIRAGAYVPGRQTLLAIRAPENLLAVRFAISHRSGKCAWPYRALVDARAVAYHGPWLELVKGRAEKLDLAPPLLTPPPRTTRPHLRDQLAEIRASRL